MADGNGRDHQSRIAIIDPGTKLVGGTGTVVVTLANNSTITLNAVGLRGSTYKKVGNMCIQGCYNDDQWSSYTFRGFWYNGWYSTFSGYDSWDFYFLLVLHHPDVAKPVYR